MNQDLEAKNKSLIDILESVDSCLIAFSGGLDSAFLSIMARNHVQGRVLCVMVSDSSTPSRDLITAKKIAHRHDLELLVMESDIHSEVRKNQQDRCYHCKQCLFRGLENIRQKVGLALILDGENASDSEDDRPGSRAAREMGVRSPLAEAGLTKDDIRSIAKEKGLEEWDRPQSACLSSRIPLGTPIENAVLDRVDKTEEFIRSKGIRMIRARVEGTGTRLELGQDENTHQNQALLKSLEPEIKLFGWDKVEIDHSGYMPAGLRRKRDE